MSAEQAVEIPEHLLKDRYWRGLFYLFVNHPKLQQYFTTQYIDLEEGIIKAAALKKIAAPWSQSERFMLSLALHLYNEDHKVNLHDMDYLDVKNKGLVMEAIRLRFG